MKAEDRILELLAEYLNKTDRILERMEQTDRNVDLMNKTILDHSLKFNQVNSEIRTLNTEIKSLNEMNQGMLKELLSISKRVSNIEEKG